MSFVPSTDENTATTDTTTTVKSPGITTPPQLAQLGLCTVRTMLELKEAAAQRLAKQKKEAAEDDELFVKRPTFSKRTRNKQQVKKRENWGALEDGEEEELDQMYVDPAGSKLFHLLEQIRTHRWIWCEFFESFVDKPILASAYDMERFMLECCPLIKTRWLPRRGWQLLRRNMGKARRFSPAFIERERLELERARRILRELQQRKFNMQKDGPFLDQIPKRIPLPLPLDAKVTSFLVTRDGLCDGRIVSYNPQECNYMVQFEGGRRPAEVFNLPDYCLHTVQESKSLALNIMLQEIASMPAIGSEEEKSKNDNYQNSPYSKTLLESLVKVKKLLNIKQKAVQDIGSMHKDFEPAAGGARREFKTSTEREKLQRRYVANMITLHRVNADLMEPLQVMHQHLNDHNKSQEESQKDRKLMPASQLYQKSRTLAELDLKSLENRSIIKLEMEGTKELMLNLQTLLYLFNELWREKKGSDVGNLVNDVLCNMLDNLSPVLSEELKRLISKVEPLQERIGSLHKVLPMSANATQAEMEAQGNDIIDFNFFDNLFRNS